MNPHRKKKIWLGIQKTTYKQRRTFTMKRRALSKSASRKHFKKNTGVQKTNHLNPRSMRGGIRLG